jgi:hypothetical protein
VLRWRIPVFTFSLIDAFQIEAAAKISQTHFFLKKLSKLINLSAPLKSSSLSGTFNFKALHSNFISEKIFFSKLFRVVSIVARKSQWLLSHTAPEILLIL